MRKHTRRIGGQKFPKGLVLNSRGAIHCGKEVEKPERDRSTVSGGYRFEFNPESGKPDRKKIRGYFFLIDK
jgi:hypothetical protein